MRKAAERQSKTRPESDNLHVISDPGSFRREVGAEARLRRVWEVSKWWEKKTNGDSGLGHIFSRCFQVKGSKEAEQKQERDIR